jgi:hypothetical protein
MPSVNCSYGNCGSISPSIIATAQIRCCELLNSVLCPMPHIFIFPRGLVRTHSARRFRLKFAVDRRMDSASESKSEPLAAGVLVSTGDRLPWRASDWRCSGFDLSFCDDVFDGCRLHVMFVDPPQTLLNGPYA